MALLRNSILAGLIVAAGLSSPARADDSTITSREDDHRSEYLDDNYIYDYMDHRDTITIGLGDATRSNIIIQHPTPWPRYINNTDIPISGQQGINALNNMMSGVGASSGSNTAGTNLSNTTSAGMTSASGN